MQLLIFFIPFRQKGAVLVKRQLKYYTINEKECQAFFENFFNFFSTFLIFFKFTAFYTQNANNSTSQARLIIYNMSRARKKCEAFCPAYFFFFICIRRRFYSSPCIFCSVFLSKNTSCPYNLSPFRRRNRGILPCPYALPQALQTACRKPCICTVKKAFIYFSFSF